MIRLNKCTKTRSNLHLKSGRVGLARIVMSVMRYCLAIFNGPMSNGELSNVRLTKYLFPTTEAFPMHEFFFSHNLSQVLIACHSNESTELLFISLRASKQADGRREREPAA